MRNERADALRNAFGSAPDTRQYKSRDASPAKPAVSDRAEALKNAEAPARFARPEPRPTADTKTSAPDRSDRPLARAEQPVLEPISIKKSKVAADVPQEPEVAGPVASLDLPVDPSLPESKELPKTALEKAIINGTTITADELADSYVTFFRLLSIR